MALDTDDPRHGTMNGYKNLGCHCDACKTAWAAWYKSRRTRIQLSPDDERHGKPWTYENYGCRCRPCTDTKARTSADSRRRSGAGPRPTADGTRPHA